MGTLARNGLKLLLTVYDQITFHNETARVRFNFLKMIYEFSLGKQPTLILNVTHHGWTTKKIFAPDCLKQL